MLVGGLNNLRANAAAVNELNVFPIRDGDTGDNMVSTLSGGVRAAGNCGGASLGEVAGRVGSGMLMSARGNSGVILSQMFAGIAKGLADAETADAVTLGSAFGEGVKSAYASVAEPVEGTMLTVMRNATEYAVSKLDRESTLESFFRDYVQETERSLEETPELLPVLKEAGVIDSGGAGVYYIVQGFLNALRGETPEDIAEEAAAAGPAAEIDLSLFGEDSEMTFGYCTEFLLRLTRKKNPEPFSAEAFREQLSAMGESVVTVCRGTLVKGHVHTMEPGSVLQFAQRFGEFLTVKIENMTVQHNGLPTRKQEPRFRKNACRKPFGVVAVGDGSGIGEVFRDLGADVVIEGGSGDNPSVELFLEAFEAVNADCIFVLPNHSNIRMAASEAAEIFKGSDVRVLPTTNPGEGYVALSALDCGSGDADAICRKMTDELAGSVSGMVSRAVRDAALDGVLIRENDYVGFSGKKAKIAARDKVNAALGLAEALGAAEREFVIVFYGAEATEEERERFREGIAGQTRAEFYEIEGGQAVYDFVIVLQ